jgi:hypothetical protein
VVCLCDGDFGARELGDRVLEGIASLHTLLPKMSLVQRFVGSHFQDKLEGPPGSVWGGPAPGVETQDWNPPVKGLVAT